VQSEIRGSPSFAYVNVDLEPGESIIAESGAMASMAADLELKARTNGGVFPALGRKLFGGESFFVSEYVNGTAGTRRLTLTQNSPGDVRELELDGGSICLQPGAYLASTPGLKLGVRWAGLTSWIAREGLFKLEVSGRGRLWFGAYGGLVDRQVDGAYIVDTSHLVAYEPQMRLRLQLSGGLFSSFFGGEGLVTRVEGSGRIVMQSRSMDGLVNWANPKLSG
jgi:uncharacterized protein (TIGR00266 family)